MGNAASVAPNENDVVKKEKKSKTRGRNKPVSKVPATQPRRRTIVAAEQDAPAAGPEEGPHPRGSERKITTATKPSAVTSTQQIIDRTIEKVPESSKDASAGGEGVHAGAEPQANGGLGRANKENEQHGNPPLETETDKPVSKARKSWEGSAERPTANGTDKDADKHRSKESSASDSETSSNASYTSSSYTGSAETSDDDASDDTFFVPEGKRGASLDSTAMTLDDRGDAAVRINEDGNDEGRHQVEASRASEVIEQAGEQEKDKSGPRVAKAKRKRPANRHYIKDETMRTLFGLVPFYGGGEGPMDQMVKSTLASVGPSTIDVRDQESNTLLILACQHACEDLVDPILAKGASSTAVNGVGICALHYTCYADSLSFDAAEALLWRGADPSTAETTYGCTPLHYAASAGDADLCALLLEHGAQPQMQDYYTYTAVKYAKDAGHDAIVEILGGEGDADVWLEVEESYAGAETAGERESGPSGGLWIRHMDPETGLAYYMNDETGESWWEMDLQAVAKDFLAAVPAGGSAAAGGSTTTDLPPLGVREWLVQEQVRSWLIAIFGRTDPLRLMEVDLVMQLGKADFKGMLKALLVRYEVKETDFLQKSSSPKLESLGVSLLMPSADELGHGGVEKATDPTQTPGGTQDTPSQPGQDGGPEESEGHTVSTDSATVVVTDNTTASKQGGRDGKTTLHKPFSSQQSLKRVDSTAVLRAEADKVFQETVAQQEKDLAEERKRQKEGLDEQRATLQKLEDKMHKQQATVAQAQKASNDAADEVGKLQAALANDNAGQDATDRLSEEIATMKASLAAERVRFSHITEALEATKGSHEERAAKQQALEEDRRIRLERLRSDHQQELESLRTEAAGTLSKTEQAWETELADLSRGLTEQVEQANKLLAETAEGAAKVLSEAAAEMTSATAATKQATGLVDEARAWMRGNQEAKINSKQIDQANKQLHTSLRREMERAKQLHNQIADMNGQTRIFVRVRPMDAREKQAGCKEVCLRDGKQTLALLTSAQQHWTFTHVFQHPSADASATSSGQVEVHREVSGLGTSLADGHSVLLMAVGAAGSGKTLTLVGSPEEAGTAGDFFLAEVPVAEGVVPPTATGTSSEKKATKKGKGKAAGAEGGGSDMPGGSGDGAAAKATPLAGILPRLVAETFATLTHRSAQCAFAVWVSAAAVSLSTADAGAGANRGEVECLLPPPPVKGDSPADQPESGKSKEEERDPQLPPPAPREDPLWGHAVAASSPQEAMAIVELARSRAATRPPTEAVVEVGVGAGRHFLSRLRVELVNRSTNEASSSDMVVVETAEERPGDTWPAALAEVVRAHAATATCSSADEGEGLIGMVKGCLADTAKVVTVLCVSPADNQAERTERALHFGKACESSGEDGASQLRDLKKELARLKKGSKGTKKTAPAQLPRPAGGKRH